jgi:hypothetical protein
MRLLSRRWVVLTRRFLPFALWLFAVALANVSPALAGFVSGVGGRTITHDGGFGGTPDSFFNEIDTSSSYLPSSFGMPLLEVPSIEVTNAITSGSNVSNGAAGTSVWYTSGTSSGRFAGGTGISQSAPDGNNSAASLKIDVFTDFDPSGDALYSLIGFYDFAVQGHVSPGGYVEFVMDMTILGRAIDYGPAGGDWTTCFAKTFHVDWVNAAAGDFYTRFSDTVGLGTLLSGDENDLQVFGSITLIAKNDSGPTSITAPNGIGFATEGSSVPEPSSWALLIGGAVAGGGWLRLCRRGQQRR